MYDFLFIKTSGEYLKLPFSEIVYVEALNKYVKIVTKKKSYLIPTTMCNIEKMLPFKIFRRIHRSYIVSLYHANRFDNNVVYMENKKIPIGKQYKGSLLTDVIVLCTDDKPSAKLSNGDIDKLLRDINPQ
jgi:DNA-binding LytR/AlgR family response regulator